MGDIDDQDEPERTPSDTAAEEEGSAVESVAGNPVVLGYQTPHREGLVTVRSMPQFEAALARARLEAEGIACFVTGGSIAATHPLVFTEVRLQVAEADKEQAEIILARPANEDIEGEYAEENWRCPRCSKKSVELLPISPKQSRLRAGCLTVLFLPLLMMGLGWAIHEAAFDEWTRDNSMMLTLSWVLLVVVLSVATLMMRREKRCTACAWRSDAPK